MELLQKNVEKLNSLFPRFRVVAVTYRTRNYPDFSKRPDLRVAVIPGHWENVVYKFNGKTHACRIDNFVTEITVHLGRLDAFEEIKIAVRGADEAVRKMGLDVVYHDTDIDISVRENKSIEKEFVERFFVKGDVLQVFRVKNGLDYGFVTLLDETAFIQKPAPGKAVRELQQAMLVNSFMRGDKTCTICLNETFLHHVAFKCMMHPLCKDCVYKVLMSRSPKCPICRAPSCVLVE